MQGESREFSRVMTVKGRRGEEENRGKQKQKTISVTRQETKREEEKNRLVRQTKRKEKNDEIRK